MHASMSTSALEALVSSITLSDLAQRSGRTVEEIVAWALRDERPAQTPRRTVAPKPIAAVPSPAQAPEPVSRRSAGGSKTVNTRTPEGRTRYDEAVLALVQESNAPVAAATIRDRLGGTPLQVRAALNRLIDEGKVTYKGRARAMRYTAR